MGHRAAIPVAVLLFMSLSSTVVAHDSKEFTVLLNAEGTVPTSIGEGVLVETDYLFFMNVDERDGVSHRIQVDADGDGMFDGVDDLATQWLNGSCELDESGSKVDDGCMVTELFLLAPENGLLPGNISMMHQIRLESGTNETGFYVIFGLDEHTEPQSEPGFSENGEEGANEKDGFLVALLFTSMIGIAVIAPKLINSEEEE
tara:strand:- start:50 stop:655 length:606 start_codon:yes stop_codon:yes gene_type:complete